MPSNESYSSNWFKFDDNDVSEFKMDDEELRNQCYGGDYTGEVYDNLMKRMAYKKQKRWWNAYILFYERIKNQESADSKNDSEFNRLRQNEQKVENHVYNEKKSIAAKMPSYVIKSVLKKNIKFLHQRNHFSSEYFQFIKRLIQANLSYCQADSINLSVKVS